MFSFLAKSTGPFKDVIEKITGSYAWIKPIAEALDNLIFPITIIIGVVGGIWVIWLGVQLAKAEGDDVQKKKKALINVIIAIVITLVILWLIVWFVASMNDIFFKYDPLSTVK